MNDVQKYYSKIRILRAALEEYDLSRKWHIKNGAILMLGAGDADFVSRLFFWAAELDTANGKEKVTTHFMTPERMQRCNRIWNIVKHYYDDTDSDQCKERDNDIIIKEIELLMIPANQETCLRLKLLD